jgi:hypothetical protein
MVDGRMGGQLHVNVNVNLEGQTRGWGRTRTTGMQMWRRTELHVREQSQEERPVSWLRFRRFLRADCSRLRRS